MASAVAPRERGGTEEEGLTLEQVPVRVAAQLSADSDSDESLDMDFARHSHKSTRRRWLAVAVGVTLLVVVGVAIGLAIANASRATAGPSVPHTIAFQFTSDWEVPGPWATSHYEGKVHKTEDDNGNWLVTGQVVWKDPTWNRTNTLSFWDNRAYVTTHDSVSGDLLHAKCVDDGGPVPTFTELKQAYTSAAKLASGDVQYFKSPSCTGAASPWVLQLGGDAFAFCDQFSASGFGVGSSDVFSFSGPGFVGKAFGVTTSASSQPVLTSAPLDRDGNALSCPVVPPVADRNAAAAATLRRLREAEVEEEEEAEQQVDEHGRKLTLTKICIFVHGAGPDTDETVASSYPEFWGNAYQLSEASRCSQALYIKRNMVDYGWDDLAMQDYFCSIATAYDSHSDTYNIHSKIIFSHGMGTLLVGAALAANKCHMKGSSKWYAIASPLGGTPGADYLNSLCTNYNTYIDQMNAEFHLCSGSGSSRTLNDAYQSLMTTYVPNGITFADVTAKVQAEVDGAMCGTSAWGLDNSQSYSLDSLSDEANLASNNDGFVEWSPCSTGPTTRATALGESWHTHYSYAFYKPSVNHLDLTCRNGDGVYNYRKPCKWIQELT